MENTFKICSIFGL